MSMQAGAMIGPYRIIEQVGRGGMATVYKAYQPGLARYVAIKVLPAFFAEEPSFRERFQQEAIAVAKLRHPNILVVFDYGEEGGITYLVSEFVEGGTLASIVGKPLSPERTSAILGPIASALDFAHERGILHRDVKPSNILITESGAPILSDFGLAKMMGSLPRLTDTGLAVGTPEYMAPEQGEGRPVGPSADNYALGVVAYEMLTGRIPFSAETPLAVLLAHLHKPLPLPRTVNPALSEAVETVLLKGLAKAPEDRYPTASDFVRALSAAGQVEATNQYTRSGPGLETANPVADADRRSVRSPFDYSSANPETATVSGMGPTSAPILGKRKGTLPFGWAKVAVLALVLVVGSSAAVAFHGAYSASTPPKPVATSVRGGTAATTSHPSATSRLPAPVFRQTTSIASSSVARGATDKIVTRFTAARGSLSDGIIDVEVYNPSGIREAQYYLPVTNLEQGQTASISYEWKAPRRPGVFIVSVGVFGPDWTTNYSWFEHVAAIHVP
jgi:serine/threonine protein kinase